MMSLKIQWILAQCIRRYQRGSIKLLLFLRWTLLCPLKIVKVVFVCCLPSSQVTEPLFFKSGYRHSWSLFSTLCYASTILRYSTVPFCDFLQKDIMLICSNAMRYNGPDTIYYKQVWLFHSSVSWIHTPHFLASIWITLFHWSSCSQFIFWFS